MPYAARIEPTLAQLRAFAVVAEELHFGRAAVRLGLSQPQVSRHVAALERELGVTLFVRTARRVTVTAAGSELLGDTRETLESALRLARRARIVARGGIGTVSVGFVWSTLNGYLAPLVAAAAERHPELELAVSQLRFAEIPPRLRRGEVDLVITRPSPEKGELIVRQLNVEQSVVALPAVHPLARHRVIRPHALDGEPLVTLSRETIPAAFDAQRAKLAADGITPSAHRGASSPSEALALVAAGLGIYYRMPASAVVPVPGVVYRALDGVGMATVLVRRPEPPSPAVRAIAELAAERFVDAPSASNDAGVALAEEPPAP